MTSRFLHSASPHFTVTTGTGTLTKRVHPHLHRKMAESHVNLAAKHEQASDVLSETQEMTPEKFIELQTLESEKWIRSYTKTLHEGKGFKQKFAFDCAAQSREDSISAILAKHG